MKRQALESNLVSILGPTTHLLCDPEQVLSPLGASVSSFVKWDICPSQGCWEILYVKSLTQGLVLSSPSPEGATTQGFCYFKELLWGAFNPAESLGAVG